MGGRWSCVKVMQEFFGIFLALARSVTCVRACVRTQGHFIYTNFIEFYLPDQRYLPELISVRTYIDISSI